MRDRFGAVLMTSMSVLFVEAVIGAIALFVWDLAAESPSAPYNTLGLFFLIVLAPILAAVGAVLGYLLSVAVVMPLLVLAGWFGRRYSGREPWWWVPALTAAATALPFPAVVALTEFGLLACLGGWLATTVGLAATALVARRLLLPDRPRLSAGVMFSRVAWYGALAVVVAGLLAGIGLYAGIGYEPPQLSMERVAGTWADDKDGTLTLTADGSAMADRVETSDYGDSLEPVVHRCTGIGSWEYVPGVAGPRSQTVVVSIPECPMDPWEVLGTPGHPKLYVYVGDPDSWDLYILQRRA
ncbi:hypothetical protein ACIOEW_07805 [Streptomyces sp. NPDC087901]|uniref:hypothetical protein n=1 Tax=Streptomyces sp. NPDC087901 TaxID=3365818 RepID=UPI00381DFED4